MPIPVSFYVNAVLVKDKLRAVGTGGDNARQRDILLDWLGDINCITVNSKSKHLNALIFPVLPSPLPSLSLIASKENYSKTNPK